MDTFCFQRYGSVASAYPDCCTCGPRKLISTYEHKLTPLLSCQPFLFLSQPQLT